MTELTVRFAHPETGTVEVAVGSRPLVVGRADGGADVALGDGRVSRRHGRVWVADGAAWYEDMGSRNGSWRDGERVHGPVRIEGRPIVLGETTLTLVDAQGAMTVRLRAPATDVDAASVLSVDRPSGHAAALHALVQTLLSREGTALLEEARAKILEVVRGAERASIVAWPPADDGTLAPLGGAPPAVSASLAREADDGKLAPLASASIAVSVSLAREAVEGRRALLLDDVGDASPQVHASVLRHGIHAAIYVPLIPLQGEPLGLLCVDSTGGAGFSQDDFQLVRAIGALLATALAGERARDAARRAEEEARTLEARRDAMAGFLKIASHDLRNPLSVIVMAAQALRLRRDEATTEALVKTIANAGTRGLDLIQTYLEMAAVDAGKGVRIERRSVDVHQLVADELEFARRLAEERHADGFTFDARITCDTVTADPDRLRQILGNLLSNAIKYSPEGGDVTVKVDPHPEGVLFSVADQGVGIAPADQQRLFRQFERVGTSVAEGIGLGLWLTAALVSAHGGRIWVESERGTGSRFSFILPSG